jgi:hypothetical protein
MDAYMLNSVGARMIISAGIINGNIALNSVRNIEIKPNELNTYLVIQYTK